MIEIRKYNFNHKNDWDNFIRKSRIDTFLLYRDFMDYHADRFIDNSYLVFRKGKLESVLPGNTEGETFYSHKGLTYGGLITSTIMSMADISQSFNLINKHLKNAGIKNVIYKPIPSIYHRLPAQEDIYELFKIDAQKIGCFISSTIFQSNKLSFTESRKSGMRKAIKEDITIELSNDFDSFWNILENNLILNYNQKPAHSLKEILYLKNKFENNIMLYICRKEEIAVGGCVLFIMDNIVHVQYISANDVGKKTGALDYLFYELINNFHKQIPVFDFGHSNENMGKYINNGLIFQKEGFGGRGIVYEIYKYNIES